jgi:hypothetical protein
MNESVLLRMREVIQEDVGNRGLRTDPAQNLITACADDFSKSCQSLAQTTQPNVAIVTGFFIPTGQPPTGETDGPLGALFLARALVPLGFRIHLVTDAFCTAALQAGVAECGLDKQVQIITLPSFAVSQKITPEAYWEAFARRTGPLTHLLALERVGPNHTLASLQTQHGGEAVGESYLDFLQEVPEEQQDRCFTMRGRDITASMSPAHWLFEAARQQPGLVTVGIGDGGNEIGMGKIAWEIIHHNIPRGGLVACRVPTDHLIVCGISNWGAYGLAAGIRALRGVSHDASLFDVQRELQLLQIMVQRGPLVDGVTGLPTATVDGLHFDRYAEVLRKLAGILSNPV